MERLAIHGTLERSEPGECGDFSTRCIFCNGLDMEELNREGFRLDFLDTFQIEKAARLLFFRPASQHQS